MSDADIAHQDLHHIRRIMARTAKFISFSGYSAIVIGAVWLGGMALTGPGLDERLRQAGSGTAALFGPLAGPVMCLVGLFGISVLVGTALTYRDTVRMGEKMLTPASLRVGAVMGFYILTGAVLGVAVAEVSIWMAAALIPALYGYLLLHLAKYSRHDITPLGVAGVVAGLYAALTGQVWLAFTVCFGVAHLVFGLYLEFIVGRAR